MSPKVLSPGPGKPLTFSKSEYKYKWKPGYHISNYFQGIISTNILLSKIHLPSNLTMYLENDLEIQLGFRILGLLRVPCWNMAPWRVGPCASFFSTPCKIFHMYA
jgi:hypothetical protein